MTALTIERAGVRRSLVHDQLRWWRASGAQAGDWLAVEVIASDGTVTDWTGAYDFLGAASWAHGRYVYLDASETGYHGVGGDAGAFLASVGLADADCGHVRRATRPPGAVAGVVSIDDVLARKADEAAAGLEGPVARVLAALEVGARPAKADRREFNRQLAALLRAERIVPNGEPWARAVAFAPRYGLAGAVAAVVAGEGTIVAEVAL